MNKIAVIGLVLTVFVGVCIAQQTNSDGLLVLMVKKQGQEQALLDGYGKTLDATMKELTKKGNLDAYVVVEAEKKRFGVERTILPNTNTLFGCVAKTCCRANVTLLMQYGLALDNFIKVEMAAGRIDSAKEAKTEKDKVSKELADLEAKMPKDVVVSGANVSGVKAVSSEVAKTNTVKKASIVGKWGHGGASTLEFTTDGKVIARTLTDNKIMKEKSGKWSYIDTAKTKIRRIQNDGTVLVIDFDVDNPDVFTQNGQKGAYRIK